MKKILSLTLALCLLLLAGCQNHQIENADVTIVTDHQEEVTSQTQITDKTPSESVTDVEEIENDDSGKVDTPVNTEGMTEYYLSSAVCLDEGENVRYVANYTYDALGNLTTATYVEGDTISNKYVFEYDKMGRVIKYGSFVNNRSEGYYTYAYDKNGNLLCRCHYSASGSLIYDEYTVMHTYNEDGNVIESKTYSGSKDSYTRSVYTYDGDGRVIKQLNIESSGKLIASYEYKYDEKGRTIFDSYLNVIDNISYTISREVTDVIDGYYYVIEKFADTGIVTSCSKYDTNDRLLSKEVFDNDNKLSYTHAYEYSDDGNGNTRKVLKTTDADGKLTNQVTEIYRDGVKVSESSVSYYSDAEGDHVSSSSTTYKDNYTETVEKNDGEVFSSEVKRYDDKGNLISSVVNVDGSVRKVENKYDPNGNLLMITSEIDKKITTIVEFEYIKIEGAYHSDPQEHAQLAFGYEI